MVRGAAEGAAHRGGRSQHRPARGDPPRAEPSSSSPALLSGGEGTSRMNICFLAFQTRPILVGRLAPEAPRVPPLGGAESGWLPGSGTPRSRHWVPLGLAPLLRAASPLLPSELTLCCALAPQTSVPPRRGDTGSAQRLTTAQERQAPCPRCRGWTLAGSCAPELREFITSSVVAETLPHS